MNSLPLGFCFVYHFDLLLFCYFIYTCSSSSRSILGSLGVFFMCLWLSLFSLSLLHGVCVRECVSYWLPINLSVYFLCICYFITILAFSLPHIIWEWLEWYFDHWCCNYAVSVMRHSISVLLTNRKRENWASALEQIHNIFEMNNTKIEERMIKFRAARTHTYPTTAKLNNCSL